MNYQRIVNNGKELFFDLDSRRTSCRDCGDLIRFGQDSDGKFYPISQSGLVWRLHKCVKTGKTELEKNIIREEETQNYLNSL